jgi:hypothetical protein
MLFPIAHFAAVGLLGKLPAVNSQEVGKSEKSRLVPMLPVSAALIGTFKAPSYRFVRCSRLCDEGQAVSKIV